MLVRRVLLLVFDLDRLLADMGDALDLELGRLHLAFRDDLGAGLERECRSALRPDIGEDFRPRCQLDDEPMEEHVADAAGDLDMLMMGQERFLFEASP